MTARLEKALNEISHEDLDISDEVKEQVKDFIIALFVLNIFEMVF